MANHYLSIIVRLVIVVLSITALVIGGFYTVTIIYPFIIGFALAFLLNPFVNVLIYYMKLPRILATAITLSGMFAILTGLVTLLIAEIISGSTYLANVLPGHLNTLIQHIETFFVRNIIPHYQQFISLFDTLDTGHQTTIMNYIQTFSAHVTTNISTWVQRLLYGLSDVLMSLPNLATVIIFSLLATFFISKDWYRLTAFFASTMPKHVSKRLRTIAHDLKQAFIGFVVAQLTLISITACIVLSGLLVLHVQYALTIALLIAIVDLIPYLGTGLIFIPWIFYSFFSGELPFTIGLSILYAIVIIQRQIMEPKILATSIGLDPLATLLSLFVGFQLFGFLGLMIGPALLVLLRTLSRADVFRDLKQFVLGSTK